MSARLAYRFDAEPPLLDIGPNRVGGLEASASRRLIKYQTLSIIAAFLVAATLTT